MSRVLAFLKKEFFEMLPPTLFFLLVFHIAIFARRLMDAEGFYLTSPRAALIGALIVGKSVLLADASPLFRLFRERPLVCNVAWRTFLYLAIVVLFLGLEELIPLVSKHDGLAPALGKLLDEIHWDRFYATFVILGLFMAIYTFVRALIGTIGRAPFLEIFFGWREEGDAGAAATD